MTPDARRGIATRVAAVVLTAIVLGAVILVASLDGTRTGSASSASSTSSSTTGLTRGLSTTIYEPSDLQGMTCPSGCSIDVPWGPGTEYPPYETLTDLVNAAWYVFTGNVTAVWTVAVGTVPITLYNVTSTTVLKAPTPNLYIPEYGGYIQVGEVGGTAANSTMSLQGYPTLTVGGAYVFFLSPSSSAGIFPGFPGFADAPFADEINHSLDNASFVSVVQMTQGGPQGLFYVKGGNVYSLDNMYPQADSWIPTKVSGMPLSQFVQEIQAAVNSAASSSTNTSTGCAESASPSKSNMATVYRVTSTRAVLCVTYSFGGAGNTSFVTNVNPWYQTAQSYAQLTQCTNATCPNVTASVSFAYHGVNADVSVVYTILSPSNLTGLFIVFHAGCSPFYLAFGLDPSSVYLTAWTCGPANMISGGYRSENWNITGSTEINTLSVPWK